MSHSYHKGEPNYNRNQLFFDNCDECKFRASNPSIMFDHVDMREAWTRATYFKNGQLPMGELPLSETEIPVLHMLWNLQVQLERCGVPLGVFPGDLISTLRRARNLIAEIQESLASDKITGNKGN